jgi:aldose 1-epimerase
VRLTSGDAVLELAPEMGGAVASWTIAGQPIFRPADPLATDARNHACYPLVPFSNRVAGRRFSFAGQDYELPALLGAWAIHGAGWQCAWTVSGNSLRLPYPGGELWPFAFDAEQHFNLGPLALTVTMRIINCHHAPAPAALGLHPFFPRDAATRMQVHAGSVWQSDSNKIPVAEIPVPEAWDFTAERELADADIDHCFAGWDGNATLVWPQRNQRLRIAATRPFRHLVIYVPWGQSFVAVEPVSNMNDGLNHMDGITDHGMVVLAPGETLEGVITMTVEALE